ncbi:hypothetical protein [Metabacillus sp. cB07]|uniref:hypothetical protein n=1 Tax=Metabacillus sp. cB07 TaxID=2806989 RepID=UPI00193A2B89|nr:hypothetical protein [Metabacillus sp. cB07]
MKQVKIQIELAGQFEEVNAYLVDDQNAVYYSDDTVWLVGVSKQGYTYKQNTAHVQLAKGQFSDPDLVIRFIINFCKNCTLWNFILNHHDRQEDVAYDITNYQ